MMCVQKYNQEACDGNRFPLCTCRSLKARQSADLWYRPLAVCEREDSQLQRLQSRQVLRPSALTPQLQKACRQWLMLCIAAAMQ